MKRNNSFNIIYITLSVLFISKMVIAQNDSFNKLKYDFWSNYYYKMKIDTTIDRIHLLEEPLHTAGTNNIIWWDRLPDSINTEEGKVYRKNCVIEVQAGLGTEFNLRIDSVLQYYPDSNFASFPSNDPKNQYDRAINDTVFYRARILISRENDPIVILGPWSTEICFTHQDVKPPELLYNYLSFDQLNDGTNCTRIHYSATDFAGIANILLYKRSHDTVWDLYETLYAGTSNNDTIEGTVTINIEDGDWTFGIFCKDRACSPESHGEGDGIDSLMVMDGNEKFYKFSDRPMNLEVTIQPIELSNNNIPWLYEKDIDVQINAESINRPLFFQILDNNILINAFTVSDSIYENSRNCRIFENKEHIFKVELFDDSLNYSAYSTSTHYYQDKEKMKEIRAFPNPFIKKNHDNLTIRVKNDDVKNVFIYDLYGNLVRRLKRMQGSYKIYIWDGTNGMGNIISSGAYICMTNKGDYCKIAVLLD